MRAEAAEAAATADRQAREGAAQRAERAEAAATTAMARAREAECLLRSMQGGQSEWQGKLDAVRRESRSALALEREKVRDLEEQLRELMLNLEVQGRLLAGAGAGGQGSGAAVVLGGGRGGGGGGGGRGRGGGGGGARKGVRGSALRSLQTRRQVEQRIAALRAGQGQAEQVLEASTAQESKSTPEKADTAPVSDPEKDATSRENDDSSVDPESGRRKGRRRRRR